MRIYRNFRCKKCKKIEEHFIDNSVETVKCECGGVATKQLSRPRYVSNTIGSKPAFRS